MNRHIKRANPGDPLSVTTDNWQVTVDPNTAILIHDQAWVGSDYAMTPALRGGSINYWVNMASMQSGCVAGLYLVTLNSACDADAAMASDPNCPSIDVM